MPAGQRGDIVRGEDGLGSPSRRPESSARGSVAKEIDAHAPHAVDDSATHGASALDAVGAWLDSVWPGLSRFEQCFARAGYKHHDDLVKHGPTRTELQALLSPQGGESTSGTAVAANKPDVGRIAAALVRLRFPRALDAGLAELEAWLEGVKPGFSLFAEAVLCAGYHDLDDLRSFPPTLGELEAILARAGAERPHVARVADAVAALHARRGAPSSTEGLGCSATLPADPCGRAPLDPVTAAASTTPADTPPPVEGASPATTPTPTVGHPSAGGAVMSGSPALRRPSATSLRAGLVSVFRGKHAMLSYQWDHQPHVLEVRRMLESVGVPCWIDVDHMVSHEPWVPKLHA